MVSQASVGPTASCRGSDTVKDVVLLPPVGQVRLEGLIDSRLALMRENRLAPYEEDYLLWPFREHCPVVRDGLWDDFELATTALALPLWDISEAWRHIYEGGASPPHPDVTRFDWQGEFIGTWIATATMVAAYDGDANLRDKVDRLIRAWLETQDADGYLGTYDNDDRWRSWDIWIQGHNLVGLLTHHDATGDAASLGAATRVADRLLADFGPGRKNIEPRRSISSLPILEPMVLLYRRTGDVRYLEFARWLADVDWEQPGGPQILSSLRQRRGVPHRHGITLFLGLAGLVELYRATDDRGYLEPVLSAWEEIQSRHVYITGATTVSEGFSPHAVLPNDGSLRVGETCATMGWIYLSLSLGKLTGQARFFDAVEQALYNQLLAAQSPDGRGWAYYVGLRDSKRYRWHTDPECCPTKGARALSLAPLGAFGTDANGIVINLFETARAQLQVGGQQVAVSVETDYPFSGDVRIVLDPGRAQPFPVRLRIPEWCTEWHIRVGGETIAVDRDELRYATLSRQWRNGDVIDVTFAMPVRIAIDALGNRGRVALMRGPLVFAVDASTLSNDEHLDDVVLAIDAGNPTADIHVVLADGSVHLMAPRTWSRPDGTAIWSGGRYRYAEGPGQFDQGLVRLVPFFEAGNKDANSYRSGAWPNIEPLAQAPTYQVWNPCLWK